MPSGVSHGLRSARRGRGAIAADRVEVERREVGQAARHGDTSEELGEDGDDVAADEDEAVDARLAQRGLEGAGAPREQDAPASGGLERARAAAGLGGVALVAPAEARERARFSSRRALARRECRRRRRSRPRSRRAARDSASGPSVDEERLRAGRQRVGAQRAAPRTARRRGAPAARRRVHARALRLARRGRGSFSSRFANSDTPRMGALRLAICVEPRAPRRLESLAQAPALERPRDARRRARSPGSASTPRARARRSANRSSTSRAAGSVDLARASSPRAERAGVARDAPAERRRRARAPRRTRAGVTRSAPPEHGREDLRRHPQHVHPRVAHGQRPRRADGVDARARRRRRPLAARTLRQTIRSARSLHSSTNVSRPTATRRRMRAPPPRGRVRTRARRPGSPRPSRARSRSRRPHRRRHRGRAASKPSRARRRAIALRRGGLHGPWPLVPRRGQTARGALVRGHRRD